jgi:hypothetical protein
MWPSLELGSEQLAHRALDRAPLKSNERRPEASRGRWTGPRPAVRQHTPHAPEVALLVVVAALKQVSRKWQAHT